ncbi:MULTISPECIES: arsenate reductase family protein [unclassified Lentimicrobium]|uniref:arsenate reductase family protein n=1 Tax=unclassified Lentimicrobium TaxID=2677434 RepID=UPI0015517868|nr:MULTISPECIES: ArsC/Spx/MgsR family protein [unclassified Lentimicrobium]NPD47382.1 arsenate reductase [Lentimicrobium sp. S6]NPD86687.1 arsenate reductase [Lentimicrobium sp. L6]
MKKIFTLSTCDTSKRILKNSGVLDLGFEVIDIKKRAISEEELDEIKALVGSYEDLFSRRSQKYKSLKLKEVNLSEEDYKKYILQEYTFLKRPVIIDDKHVFVGNSKANVETLNQYVLQKSLR